MRQRGFHSTPSPSPYSSKMKVKKIFGFSISLVLINLASILERADETLLPAVYKEVSEEFNASPTELGYLTFVMSFVQSISSPIAGVLALQYDRSTVLAVGTASWAVSTAAVGISQHIQQVAFWRAVNGFGLAIVIPVLQSFIADSYGDGSRGAGFGLFSFVSMIGRIGGGPLATIMAGKDYWGIPGWRFAFLMMASISLLIALLVHLFVVDPRKNSPVYLGSDVVAERSSLIGEGKDSLSPPSLWRDSWIAIRSVAKVKTFQIIVLQGIVGSLPWASIVFFTMWFELIGTQVRLRLIHNFVYGEVLIVLIFLKIFLFRNKILFSAGKETGRFSENRATPENTWAYCMHSIISMVQPICPCLHQK